LIMNLLTSFADDDEEDETGKVKSETENVDDDETGTWVGEYQRGCDWEIYSTTLAEMFEGVQFAALSEVLYQKLGL
jgi:Calcium-activated BK potassium channel alpha subunit